jgi:outer membrane receptor protein involved in Fe transport
LVFTGPVDFIELPTAAGPLAMSFGFETREETGIQEPDDCLKLAPASCQGGAGGNILPVKGGYQVDEFFFEGILPIFDGQSFADSMDLEFGFRSSDYDTSGSNNSWKIGLNWRPVDSLLLRVMQQEANRAPNVGELASPVVTGLSDATLDPCSIANAANIDAALRQLCISTGMSDAQVGQVQDIISGQVSTFDGSDPNALPDPEEADTFTAGFVWTPEFSALNDFSLSVDYYDIDISNIIGEFSPQEVLDACYVEGDPEQCAKINRIGGDLTISGAGIELFTTNLEFLQAEGIEIGFNFGLDLGDMGELKFSGNINKYLTQESRSAEFTALVDCKGFYGTSCDPISDLRWIQRTTWIWNDLTVSAQWRHIDSIDIQENEAAAVFEAFRQIESYDYVDLFTSYSFTDKVTFTLGVDNLFDKDAPVLGNEVGDTSSNSGNTFPSNYDNLGRVYRAGLKIRL